MHFNYFIYLLSINIFILIFKVKTYINNYKFLFLKKKVLSFKNLSDLTTLLKSIS